MTHLLNWFGSLAQGQGYSGASEQLALALDRRDDVDVRTVGFNRMPSPNVSQATKKLKNKPFQLADVGVVSGFPNNFTSLAWNKFKVGRTMFETDTLPSGVNDWCGETGNAADAINPVVDLLCVPCKHNVELFRNHGITVPIEIVPDGVNPQLFKFYDRSNREAGHKFTFFMHGTLTLRKNAGMVIAAFANLFRDNPDVQLILKTQSGTLGHIEYVDMGNIVVIDELMPVGQIIKMMNEADAYLFPTRGEGFGIPPLEAMATGLPTVIAGNTGMLDYSDDRYNITVPTAKKSPAQRYPKKWGNVGQWYEPDYQSIKDAMWWIYTHQDEAMAMGKRASEWVRSEWTYDQAVEKLVVAIKKHYPDWQ